MFVKSRFLPDYNIPVKGESLAETLENIGDDKEIPELPHENGDEFIASIEAINKVLVARTAPFPRVRVKLFRGKPRAYSGFSDGGSDLPIITVDAVVASLRNVGLIVKLI